MNKITNETQYSHHPLYNLLLDCIRANTGGSTSEKLIKAWKIQGWNHSFNGWDLNGFSNEALTWNSEATYNQLVEIYSK